MDTGILNKLISLGEVKSFKPGEIVFDEGSVSREFCYILEGRVIAEKNAGPGDYINILTISAGELFGEMALWEEGRRLARIKAADNVKIAFIGRKVFLDFLDANPREGLDLFKFVTQRILERIAHTNRQMSCFYQLSRLTGSGHDAKDFIAAAGRIILSSFSFSGLAVFYYNDALDRYEEICRDGLGDKPVILPGEGGPRGDIDAARFGAVGFPYAFALAVDMPKKTAATVVFFKAQPFSDNEKGFLSALSPTLNSCFKDIIAKEEQKNLERLKQRRYDF